MILYLPKSNKMVFCIKPWVVGWGLFNKFAYFTIEYYFIRRIMDVLLTEVTNSTYCLHILRFDLIYLILDKADEQTDRRLAKHIVSLHFENPEV